MHVRSATRADAPSIAAVYAPHVLHGTASFEETPPDAAEMGARLARILDHRWPWLVAEEDGVVVGYAYAGQMNPRAGYRYSCESSIYVDPDAIGRGVGQRLLRDLMREAAAAGFLRMVAVIGDSANAASIGLHRAHGFTHAGLLKDVGYKFGRWLDVVHMQHTLELP